MMKVILTFLYVATTNRFVEVAASMIKGNVFQDYTPSVPYEPYVGSSLRTRSGSYSDRPLSPPNTIDNVVSCGSCCFPDPTPIMESSFVTDVSNPYRDSLLTDNFFQKVIDVNGIPVAGSAAVSDQALLEEALTLAKMSAKVPSLLTLLRTEEVYFAVIGKQELLTDIPGYASLGPAWDWPRGVGATRWYPISSCAEENLLCLEDDAYSHENICVHETAHTLQGSGGKLLNARVIDGLGDLDDKLTEIFNKDVDGGLLLWKNTYAATRHEEMWAEGVQSYFDVNREGPVGGDGVHNEVYYRELLQLYHPELYEVIDMVFASDVEFKCPPNDFNDCDCSVIRDQCERAGIALVPTTSPTSHPTPPPTPEPTPDVSRSSVDKTLCSENAQCAALDGFCCPNNVGDILACCDPPTDSPSTAPSPFTQAPSNSPSLSTPVPSVAPTVAPASTEPSAAISTEPSAGPTETGPSAPSGSPGNSNGISQEDNEAGNGFWSNFFTTGSIVGVSVGFALLVLLMFTILYMQRRSQNPSQGRSTKPVNTLQLEEEKDSISAISQSKSNEAPTGNQSIGTSDYDFKNAYGGVQPLVDPNGASVAGPDGFGYFDQESQAGTSVREEIIHIFAPPGKLGVIIDTPNDGPPVVSGIKDPSVIAGKVKIGDKLIAVDDEDVSHMTAIAVSKVIGRKSTNPSRKFTIRRTTVVEDGYGFGC